MDKNKENIVVESKSLVEKRLRPTLIRRRSKKIETPAEALSPEFSTAKSADGAALETPLAKPLAQQTPDQVDKGTKAEPQAKSEEEKVKSEAQVEKPTAEESKVQRIGVVGHIDDLLPSVKGDWQTVQTVQPQKKVSKKRKSKADLDMEDIQRAGGLKSYASIVGKEEVVSAVETEVTFDKERVFRPGISRRRKLSRREVKQQPMTQERKESKKVIRLEKEITVGDISQALGVKVSDIVKRLMDLGIMATVNQLIDAETAEMIAQEHGFRVEKTGIKENEILKFGEAESEQMNLRPRPPVVTVMGHVDHGKTSILDVIRKTKVAEGEAGGITQHIGAYQVHLSTGAITFIDTPGHEAFTSMRARGAKVTDLVILVVAADDGVMPQTIEAIDHAKAAGVPILVAVNKIDKSNAQPDRVKQQLAEHGLVPEDWGGQTIFVQTSALKKQGVDQLLEMILLQSEVLELKADPSVRPMGIVIEARLDKGRGPVATVIIKEGTLRKGDFVLCGEHVGKARSLLDAFGKEIKEAGPSVPVEILGLSGIPNSGDQLVGISDEKAAKELIEQRRLKRRNSELSGLSMSSLEDLQRSMDSAALKELNLVIKGDVRGTVEAISSSLEKLSTDKVKVLIVHVGVGGITESDVMLAVASNAIVVGFNVAVDVKGRESARQFHVEIRTYKIIYELLEDIQKAMKGLLDPKLVETVLGRAQIREIFHIGKIGTVAGCMIVSGKVVRNAKVRLLRENTIVFEGAISSLKRFKDDAKEVAEGYECGISLEGYNDLKVGDVIEAFIIEKKSQE